MARSLRSAAIRAKRSRADLSFTSRLCSMFMSLRRVRKMFRSMAFLHAAPPSCSFTVKNANCCGVVPAANFSPM